MILFSEFLQGGGGASEIREGHLRLDSGARPRRTSEPEGHLSLLHRFSTKRFFFARSEFFRAKRIFPSRDMRSLQAQHLLPVPFSSKK